MPVYKRKIDKDFTVVHNAFVRDKALGINARGILITMLSMPEYNSNGEPWNFTIRGLAEMLPDGKAKIQSALNELEKHGYLMRKKIVCKGRFVDVEYTFSDEPMPEAITAYEEKQKNKKEKSINSENRIRKSVMIIKYSLIKYFLIKYYLINQSVIKRKRLQQKKLKLLKLTDRLTDRKKQCHFQRFWRKSALIQTA